jgi:NADH-quinone oxidoreductase subunit L
MEQLLQLFIFIPLIGFFFSFIFVNKQEKLISAVAYASVGLQLAGIILFTIYWIFNGFPVLDLKHFVFFKEDNIEIFLNFYFDWYTAIFALTGSLITFLVVIFSKYYLHRDEGYKRFFNTVLLFFFGYNVTIFAGNFETLFVGWEFLGITSFLLIAFYRDRYLPVKNALKTISLFRLGDICLMLALWTSHHIWHENITFAKLENSELVASHIAENYASVIFLISMIIIAASIKSAQFPFSSWLPRAMEGPTTSSAVFYGSLSVHLGVFLLLRTHNYWESISLIKIIIITIGVCTAVVATSIARVQSTVKTQIAYSSIAQIGLMFIEVALGWHLLAMIHFSGNAFLRTYQLLVSPSVLGYMIHDQFFNYTAKLYKSKFSFSDKISNSIYLLGAREWNMDRYLKKILWDPFKFAGKRFQFLNNKKGLYFLCIFFVLGFLLFAFDDHLPEQVDKYLHLLFAFIGTILVLVAFTEKKNALKAWYFIIISQFYLVLAIAKLNDEFEYVEILLYAIGLLFAAVAGIIILLKLKAAEKELKLNDFYGHIYHHPKWGNWFLVACLAFVSLPFTPSFIGIDLMFSHVDHDEYVLITLISVSFLVLELSVLRIYARLFLGPHKRQTHPIAYRSS